MRRTCKALEYEGFKGFSKRLITLAIRLVGEWPGMGTTIWDCSLALHMFPRRQARLLGLCPGSCP